MRIGEIVARQGAGLDQHSCRFENLGVVVQPVFDKLNQQFFDGSLWAKGLLPTLIAKLTRISGVGWIHCYFLARRFLPVEHYL